MGPSDFTDTLPLPKLKAKMPLLLTTLTVPLTLGFGVNVVHPIARHEV
jgi:hypothetical protein